MTSKAPARGLSIFKGKAAAVLTQEALNDLFDYNPETGELKRRVPSPMARETERKATAYQQVRIDGRSYRAHRVIWLMVFGEIPEGMVIDHVNGDTNDNRLSNLRLAQPKDNNKNTDKPSHNTSGYKGVSKKKNGWRAYIVVENKQRHLGIFPTAVEAARKYDEVALEIFGPFARTNVALGTL